METKMFNLKQIGDSGEGSAVIATLNQVDRDQDITLSGAFGTQPVVVVPAHNWNSVPLGKGTISEAGNEAVVDFKLNLDSPTGKEWHSALKFDLQEGPPLQQWSYGYDILESEDGVEDEKPVQYLKKLKVFEVSPVLIGAGINTRTLDVKQTLEAQFGSVEEALAATKKVTERIEALAALRAKEGRTLSRANRTRLNRLLELISDVQSDIDKLLAEADKPDDTDKAAILFCQYQKTRAAINHLIS